MHKIHYLANKLFATECQDNDIYIELFQIDFKIRVLRNANNQSWYGDIDLGEMFLNYFLDEKLLGLMFLGSVQISGNNGKVPSWGFGHPLMCALRVSAGVKIVFREEGKMSTMCFSGIQ